MRCLVCKKKCEGSDYWKLCEKCAPAWFKGRDMEQNRITKLLLGIIKEIKND